MNKPSPELQKVADYFIGHAHQKKQIITNKKLQKLTYYAQAWNLALNDSKLYDEPVEAWIHGPAIRVLYNKYKKYGFMGIADQATVPTFGKKEQEVIDDVWDIYGKFDADYLETLTHNEQPWIVTRGNADDNQPTDIIISTDLMKAFYRGLLKTVKA
jgi:uncharacterized phage-associated protein